MYDITKRDTFNYCVEVAREMKYASLKAIVGTHRDHGKDRAVTYADGIKIKSELDGVWGEMGLNDSFNAGQIL